MRTTNPRASIFLIPNATFIAELVAFVIILYVLWKYVVPHIQSAMRDRQELIASQLRESREAKERMEQAEREYKESLGDARAQAAQIRETARAEAQRILDEVKDKAQAEADRITARGEEQLAAQRRQVISELRTEIGQLSVDLAGRIIGASLQDEDSRRATVDSFLDDLDGMSEGSADDVAADGNSARAGDGSSAQPAQPAKSAEAAKR